MKILPPLFRVNHSIINEICKIDHVLNPTASLSRTRSAITRDTDETLAPIPTPFRTPTEPSKHFIYPTLTEAHVLSELPSATRIHPALGPQSLPVSQEFCLNQGHNSIVLTRDTEGML